MVRWGTKGFTAKKENLWNSSCTKLGEDGEPGVMSDILSRVFVIAVLLFYAGLIMGFLLWNLGRWLRRPGKKRPWPAILEHLSTLRIFNRSYNAR
jgi:hypothetical protein